jgi:hypothetical protein
MTASDEYRRLAQECLAASRLASTALARAALIEMAGTWLRLAKEHDNDSPMTQIPPKSNDNQD